MTRSGNISLEAARAGLQPPYVSIVVPVYNTQEQLAESLMSAVFQTLPETEVIVVNDASPDNSQEIIDWFVDLFPEKVRCIVHECNRGLAAARRTGTLQARAPYVVFLDSDDFISGKLCEVLLEENLRNDYDILYFASDWCDSVKKTRRTMWPPKEFNPYTMIQRGAAAFWGAMYRRDFLLEHQQLAFQNMKYEDAAATPILINLADKIGSCRANMYFYNTGREGSITAASMTESKKNDLFLADVVPWENVSELYYPALAERILRRAAFNTKKYPEIYDYSVHHVQKLLRLTEDYEDNYPPADQDFLEELRALPDEIRIPKRVYVNGFLREQVRDFDRYLKEAHRAYLFEPQVIVLDDSVCPESKLPQWLHGRSAEEKGLYLAVRLISEQGGIYISPAVTVTKSFNREAFSGAFFVAGPQNLVLPVAFGAEPGNPVLQAMRAALEKGPAKENLSVAEIMSLVLIGECGVHLDGKEEHGLHGLHMLQYKYVCQTAQRENSYCELDFSNFSFTFEELVVLPRPLYDMAWNMAENDLTWSYSKIASLRKELATARAELKKAKKKAQSANKKLKKIEGSRIWKLVNVLYKLEDWVKQLFGL